MRGLILAAGKGSRLNGTAGDKPKCLVKAGGLTLLERSIRALRVAGVTDIAVVVGCQADEVRNVCGPAVDYVENLRFAETNSLYSLWMARALLYQGFVVLNCDVLFHSGLLATLLRSPHDAALLAAFREPGQQYGDEEMKIRVDRGRVVEISKSMAAADADAENLGIVKFGSHSAPLLMDILDDLVRTGGLKDWAPKAFHEFAQRRPLHVIGTNGLPWIEIDFPEDYARALREVLPAIDAMERVA